MSGRHYLAFGPYDCPQEPPHYSRDRAVQLVEEPQGFFHQRAAPAVAEGVTPAAALLHDLVATMQAIANLYKETPGMMLDDNQHARLDKLEARQAALEAQLQREVSTMLGIDYAILWHAVTPTGPVPKLP